MTRMRRGSGVPTYLSGIVAGVWVVLAWTNPTNTYFIAPLLVGAAFPIGQWFTLGRLSRAEALGAATGGLVNVAVATGLLTVADRLRGDAVLAGWHPGVEALVLGLAGVGATAALATRVHRRERARR